MKFRIVVMLALAAMLIGCSQVGILADHNLSEAQLKSFFRHHTISGHPAVALEKRSMGGVSYLMTIHGYPNSLKVCQEIVRRYNENPSLSVIPGHYYCEVLK